MASSDFPLLLKAAAAHMPDALGVQAPRKEVPGLVVPRRPAPRILPQNMGRGKGTVPTNPFSGNWQPMRPPGVKVAATAAEVATATGAVGGAVLGGAAGAYLDRQRPIRGALLGTLLGLPAGATAGLAALDAAGRAAGVGKTPRPKTAMVTPGLPERAGRAVGGFVGKHPVTALALAYGAYRAPDIVRAVKTRTTDLEPPVGYGTVHAVRGLAQVPG